MADSWEDWEDDDLVAGVSLNEVDESKFAGEDQQAPSTWDDDKPQTQPRKAPVESKYAAKDREYAAKFQTKGFVGEDKAARQAAVEEADIVAARELFGQGEPSKLDTMVPKNNVEFDEYAQLIISKYVMPHKSSKQWKYFIKSLVRQACEPLGKDEIKDIESAVAGVRSDKVKAELAAAKEAKKGAKKNLKMESDDIAAAMDYRGGAGVNNDDDYDFM